MIGLPKSIANTSDDLTSGILPIVCQQLSEEQGRNLVDLGAAFTGNYEVLSRNGTRVYLDTSDTSLRSRIIEGRELPPAELDALTAFYPGKIDAVLFWDILDHLSLDSIESVMRGFAKLMRRGGLVYAMVTQQLYMPAAPAVIEVIQENLLRFQYDTPIDRQAPQYAPRTLESHMPGFLIDKLYLLQNGVQEHLFLFEGID